MTDDGRAVWRASGLRARRTMRVEIPARLLRRGEYLVILDRALGTGDRETIEEYAFTAVPAT